MHEWTIEFIRCVRCQKKLELEKLEEKNEIIEGFLSCQNCNISYPIISKVPILYNDFTRYLSSRASLGGELLLQVSPKMKKFVKKSLSKIKREDDRTRTERNWTRIYQNSMDSKFYSVVKKTLDAVPNSKLVLEHGCSIGIVSEHLAKRHDTVFGIDSSYYSTLEAKKSRKTNLDYIVADSLEHPFGNQKFGLVVALNLLEIIEPENLLKVLSRQINNAMLLSSPYDYERGTNSIKKPILENDLRKKLAQLGFSISLGTKKPGFIQWKLVLNSRANLNYKVDLILAKRNS